MKAQLLSMDFVIALSLLTASIGLLTQASDRLQTRSLEQALYAQDSADAIAASLAGEGTLSEVRPYCAEYSNGVKTGSLCNTECERNTLTHSRLVNCFGSACLLTVKTCDDGG